MAAPNYVIEFATVGIVVLAFVLFMWALKGFINQPPPKVKDMQRLMELFSQLPEDEQEKELAILRDHLKAQKERRQ